MLEPAATPTMVSSDSLTDGQRQSLWRGIQRKNPRLAKLIRKRALAAADANQKPPPIKLALHQFHRYAKAGVVETINTSSLSADEQDQLFLGMRRLDPERADFLANDNNINQILSTFGGGHEITLPDYHRYMTAGSTTQGADNNNE